MCLHVFGFVLQIWTVSEVCVSHRKGAAEALIGCSMQAQTRWRLT